MPVKLYIYIYYGKWKSHNKILCHVFYSIFLGYVQIHMKNFFYSIQPQFIYFWRKCLRQTTFYVNSLISTIKLWYDFSSGQLFGFLQTVICLLISHINNIMGYWKFDSVNIWSVAMFSRYISLQQIFMWYVWCPCPYINGLVQDRRNSSALIMELVSLALTHRYVAII